MVALLNLTPFTHDRVMLPIPAKVLALAGERSEIRAQDTGWEGFSVLIADENGNEVARLPVVP